MGESLIRLGGERVAGIRVGYAALFGGWEFVAPWNEGQVEGTTAREAPVESRAGTLVIT